jgi:hypothetical protein
VACQRASAIACCSPCLGKLYQVSVRVRRALEEAAPDSRTASQAISMEASEPLASFFPEPPGHLTILSSCLCHFSRFRLGVSLYQILQPRCRHSSLRAAPHHSSTTAPICLLTGIAAIRPIHLHLQSKKPNHFLQALTGRWRPSQRRSRQAPGLLPARPEMSSLSLQAASALQR